MEAAALLSDIRFTCAHCAQPLVVSAEAAGVAATCPSCERAVSVPSASARLRESREALVSREMAEAARLRHELAEALALAEGLELEAGATAEKLSHAQHALGDTRAELAQARLELEGIRTSLTAEHAAADDLRQSWEDLCAKERRVRAELATEREVLASARRQLTALASQLEAQTVELGAARSELVQRRGIAEELEQALAEHTLGETAAQAEAQQWRARAAELEVNVDQSTAAWLEAESAREALAHECAARLAETVELKRQLSESESGREMLALREGNAALREEVARLSRATRAATHEADKQTEAARRLEEDFRRYRQRAELERAPSEEAADDSLRTDVGVLRGIVERQRHELGEQQMALAGLRRAHLGVRLTYALLGLAAVGLGGAIVFWLQRLWGAGW